MHGRGQVVKRLVERLGNADGFQVVTQLFFQLHELALLLAELNQRLPASSQITQLLFPHDHLAFDERVHRLGENLSSVGIEAAVGDSFVETTLRTDCGR